MFIAGLMVGRTPEYLGKKIEAYDVKMAMLVVLVFPLTILVFAAISMVSPSFGTSQLNNAGPHGLSEILYAFTSGTANNGSAFAGISANTLWYNSTIGMAMLVGRFFMIIPMLAIAGNLARKKTVPPSLGTFPVTTPLFTTLLVSVIRDRRRADFLSGAQLGTNRGASVDAGREDVLILECGDLSPLWSAAAWRRISASTQVNDGCDRSQTTKALTGQRTPKS